MRAITDRSRAAELIARLDRLPTWPHSNWVLAVLAVGWFFAYFDIGNIAFALPVAIKHFNISSAVGASVVSAGLVGYIIGEVGVSLLSEWRGRRPALLVATLLYAVGSLATALSTNATMFIAFRFISGAGIGAFIGVASAYVSEILPSSIRGKFAAWTTMPALIGNGVVPFLALAIVPPLAIGWRLILLIPILGVIPILAGWKNIPESLRWSLSHRDFQAAEQFVQHCESRVQQKLGGTLPEIAVTTERIVTEEESQHFSWKTLFQPPLLWLTVLLFFIWFFNYFGVYGWNGVGVTLLVEQGYTLVHSIQMSIAGTIGGIVGALIAPQVTDRFPRKWPPFIVTLLLAAELFLLGFGPNNLLITLEFGLLAFQVGIFAPIVYLLTAEHFPTEGRNLGVAVTDGIGHIGGAIGPVAVTAIYGGLGFSPVFLAIGISFILCAVLLLFTKRTNRQNLEEIVLEEVEGAPVSVQEKE